MRHLLSRVLITSLLIFFAGAPALLAQDTTQTTDAQPADTTAAPSDTTAATADTTGTDLLQTLQKAEGFDTLAKTLSAADLTDFLKGDGPFTLFAPTDEAFEELPKGALTRLLQPENKSHLQTILRYHIVEDFLTARDIRERTDVKTVEGRKIAIETKGDTTLLKGDTEGQIIETDRSAGNGIIHVVDTVLMPPPKSTMRSDQN